MKLNSDSRIASFFRYFYGKDEMPKDFCTYFWLLVLATVLTPFVWPALAINRIGNKITKRTNGVIKEYYVAHDFIQTPYGIIFNLFLFLIGGFSMMALTRIGIFSKDFGDNWPLLGILLYLIAFGVLTIIAIIFAFKVIGYFVRMIKAYREANKIPLTEEEEYQLALKERDRRIERERRKIENPGIFRIIRLRIKAYKEKNCPIIEWENKKE